MTRELEKYDRIASGFSEREYADPEIYARRRAHLALALGPRLQPGASVLDLGCGDGVLAPPLVAAGFAYIGMDASESMIEVARAGHPGLRFELGTIDEFEPSEPVDCTICLRALPYTADRTKFFAKVRSYTLTKFVFDTWLHDHDIDVLTAELRAAGFGRIERRPFFLPQSRHVPGLLHPLLLALERSGPVARVLLRRHGRVFFAASA